ncbi:MAG: CopG family transcriptional regulator [Pseudomonadota bacterium]|nr:CopG family transcriptional regulator [Pseudomonadota bacterium]
MSIISAKNPRGRPRVDSEPVNVRLVREDLSALDAWIAANAPDLTRPEAIRRLMRQALDQQD